MKVRQIIGIIEADGWRLVRTRGSTRQYEHPRKPGRVTIPGKRSEDLHPTTAVSILRRAGVDQVSAYPEQAEKYVILIEGEPPSNYSAWSPDLPGCVATGASIDECEAETRDAIVFHLEGFAEDGGPIPDGSGPGVYVERTPRLAA